MKSIIITIGLSILASIMILCQNDVNQMQRQSVLAKSTVDQVANTAGLCLDDDKTAVTGDIYYDYDEAVKQAGICLQTTMGYTESFIPTGSYFTETATLDLYFFDGSKLMRHYSNGTLQETQAYEYTQKLSNYVLGIDDAFELSTPCVVAIYDAGKPKIRLNFSLSDTKIKKSSVYEYKTK